MISRRLRGNQPNSSAIDQRSTPSSVSSGKQEKSSTSILRQQASMTKSPTPQSSSDEAERTGQVERGTRQTRLQKREASSFDGANDKAIEDDLDEDDADGEVTRCVCGQLDYPGPPVPLSDGSRNHNPKDNAKLASLAAAEGLPEDAGGLFIQCDKCHVWQHGGCVGIMQEELSPDNYYCEQCRNDLHKVTTGARGQRYSRYLPITEHTPAKTPRRPSAKDSESRSSREADSKAGTNMSSAKRRSTMNSRRDVEEEEMLKRAIEQSKSEEGTSVNGNGARRSKRGRDDDTDESRDGAKRRKTASESVSPQADPLEPIEGSPEGDEHEDRARSNTHVKKSRNAATQAQRERDFREREREKEAERVEAAGRRRGRADRRRVDESEAPEDLPRPAANPRSAAPTKNTRPQMSTKMSSNAVTTTSTSHKKKATTKKGRVGRNQYTKDREQAQEKKTSPRPSNSHGSDDIGNINEIAVASMLSNGSKPSKPRHMNPNRTSMNDLRKRAAGILEYITRTQVEMAGQQTPSSKDKDSSGSCTPSFKFKTGNVNGSSKLSSEVNGTQDEEERHERFGGSVDEASFKALSSLEMMDVLTRELVFWQKDFGKYGEKT